jgi:hypothetical protein
VQKEVAVLELEVAVLELEVAALKEVAALELEVAVLKEMTVELEVAALKEMTVVQMMMVRLHAPCCIFSFVVSCFSFFSFKEKKGGGKQIIFYLNVRLISSTHSLGNNFFYHSLV